MGVDHGQKKLPIFLLCALPWWLSSDETAGPGSEKHGPIWQHTARKSQRHLARPPLFFRLRHCAFACWNSQYGGQNEGADNGIPKSGGADHGMSYLLHLIFLFCVPKSLNNEDMRMLKQEFLLEEYQPHTTGYEFFRNCFTFGVILTQKARTRVHYKNIGAFHRAFHRLKRCFPLRRRTIHLSCPRMTRFSRCERKRDKDVQKNESG